jgi:chemotaxis protein methyltransferase CheR
MSIANRKDPLNRPLFEIAHRITEITGNQFSEKHRSMLENRLKKRAIDLRLSGLDDYLDYFKHNQDDEVKHLISLLTTHHTFFFREFGHFEYLEEKVLPDLIPIARARADKKITIWSAACSRGHEVYSLGMFLDFYLKKMAPDLNYEILGTDIDPESVAFAKNGVYSRKEIKEAPLIYLADHWARGTGPIVNFVKVKTSLRTHTRWDVFNLLKFPQGFHEMFDIIFCRNVYIYFNSEQIKHSTSELMRHLHPHGHFFVGISESLTGLNLPINTVGPSIYRHLGFVLPTVRKFPAGIDATVNNGTKANLTLVKDLKSSVDSKPAVETHPTKTSGIMASSSFKDILRVVCVDDSPSIITLMKKILSLDEGFDVVGIANNGLEAHTKIKELKPDVVTLDIHMPQQTGIEYLVNSYKGDHPPVIMVSSVSRDESDLAIKALSLGASDYVEKPALSNLPEIGEEIRRKLRSAYRNQVQYKHKVQITLDEAFKKVSKVTHPDKCVRIIIGTMSDKKRISSVVNELGRNQPPTFILLDAKTIQEPQLAKDFPFNCTLIGEWPDDCRVDSIYIAEANSVIGKISTKARGLPASFMVFGEVSPKLDLLMKEWKISQVLLEDLGTKRNQKNGLKYLASDVVPATSFAYMSSEYLGRKA